MKMLGLASVYSRLYSYFVIFSIHSGRSCYIPSKFEVHSKYSSCILYEFFDVERYSAAFLPAFWLHSYNI